MRFRRTRRVRSVSPGNIDSVTLLRGRRAGVAEWRRAGTKSPLRTGETQIDADTFPIVPTMRCVWAPPTNQSTTPPYRESGRYCSSCRRHRVSANMALVVGCVWVWGGGRKFGPPSLEWAKSRLRMVRSIPYDPPACPHLGSENENAAVKCQRAPFSDSPFSHCQFISKRSATSIGFRSCRETHRMAQVGSAPLSSHVAIS